MVTAAAIDNHHPHDLDHMTGTRGRLVRPPAVQAAGGGMSADVTLNCVCGEGVPQMPGMKFVKF